MDFICNDPNGPSQWFFDADAKMYVRKTMIGEHMRYLPMDVIADPENIRAHGREPQASTIALWNHRKTVQ